MGPFGASSFSDSTATSAPALSGTISSTVSTKATPSTYQYAGPKAALRPIYLALIAKAKKLGKDVELAPRKAYVGLRRSKQFALIQPSTKTRVDLGLNLRGVEPTGRLEASGSFSGMCTHRVRLERVKDVDKELLAWVEQAYRGAAAK